MKKAQKGREIRDPEQEYFDSFYYDAEGKIAFPALSIKQAMVNAARSIEGVTMTLLKGAVFVKGDKDGFIPLEVKGKTLKLSAKVKMYEKEPHAENVKGYDSKFPTVEMREDTVRVGMGSADLRFRGQVSDWSMSFLIQFNADVLSAEQVLNLLQIAGFSCGLGEWRPERSGDFGTFEVEKTSESALH